MKRDGRFQRGRDAVERGRKGGQAKALARRASREPWSGTLVDLLMMTYMRTWTPWLAFAKAISGLGDQMTDEELRLYRLHTRREDPPSQPIDECVMMIGTGAGKTTFSGLAAVHQAITFDPAKAAGGETILVPLIAKDRSQARNALGYVRDFCTLDVVRPYVSRGELKSVIEFKTGVDIEIATAHFGSVRGFSNASAVLDEVAYWQDADQGSSNPDVAILNAIRTRLARVPGSQLLILSSPHAPRGVLHQMHEMYFGRAEESERDRVLFWCASTLAMRPNHPKPYAIEKAFRLDPQSAIAEYGLDGFVQFRQHSQAVFELERVDPLIIQGRNELAPVSGVRYHAFLDMSQGRRNGDSATLAISHRDGSRAVLDFCLERVPPFNPSIVLAEFAEVLHRYRLTVVHGDRVSLGFVESALSALGIRFEVSTLDKSAIYLQALHLVNAGAVELLDNPTLRQQLSALQRYSAAGASSKERVDHPRGGRDDVANSVCGSLVLCGGVGATAKKRLLFSDSYGGREPTQHEKLAALAKSTLATFAVQDELDRRRMEESEDLPMTSQPTWFVHTRN